jgi:hypothetical protein
MRPIRSRNIPTFRDIYAQRLAENPLTEFDFIGHSNGTYIFGRSLLSTPSMQFGNVVLAAPVLPTDFDWSLQFSRRQIRNLRYDVASLDWPVGILCPILNALGFSDVGPSGVVLFGEGIMASSKVQKVGWYQGGHSSALRYDAHAGIDDRQHLLNFAIEGIDVRAGEVLEPEVGWMQHVSRATPWLVWLLLAAAGIQLLRLYRAGKITRKGVLYALASLVLLYAALDII